MRTVSAAARLVRIREAPHARWPELVRPSSLILGYGERAGASLAPEPILTRDFAGANQDLVISAPRVDPVQCKPRKPKELKTKWV